MKTTLIVSTLILLVAVGCSGPADTENVIPVDEPESEGMEQPTAVEEVQADGEASTAQSVGETVGGTARSAGEAVKEGTKTGVDTVKKGGQAGVEAVVEGAKKVGKTAADVAAGVAEGAKGEKSE